MIKIRTTNCLTYADIHFSKLSKPVDVVAVVFCGYQLQRLLSAFSSRDLCLAHCFSHLIFSSGRELVLELAESEKRCGIVKW